MPEYHGKLARFVTVTAECLFIGRLALNHPPRSADFLLTAMKITTKQKIYGVVLTLGVAAFIIDRAYFTPSSAIASPPKAETSNHTDRNSDPQTLDPSTTSESLIAAKLRSISPLDWDHLADAFSPRWMNINLPGGHSEFAMKHKLTAVLASHGGGGAIVNGALVRVGQSIDGFTLIAVDRQGAIFASGNTRVTLTINQW
jgi:hypothetical protein